MSSADTFRLRAPRGGWFPIQNAVTKSERASCPSASATFRFA